LAELELPSAYAPNAIATAAIPATANVGGLGDDMEVPFVG
jgi:hypothetical protein